MKKERVFGLDFIRAVAILLVLVGHLGHVGLMQNNYVMYQFGFFGVELFFVLSGFLIGQILIELVSTGVTLKSVRQFWIKRWIRTLPLYYLVLIIRLFVEKTEFPYLHFIFLQNSNIIENYNSYWFGESWSLAIEEFFYLTIPILLFVLNKIFKNKKGQLLGSLFAIIVASLIIRIYFVLINNTIDFENEIRKFTFLRLDSLSCGVLIAFLKIYYQKIFQLFQNKFVFAAVIFVFLILILIGNFLVYDFIGIKLIPSTIGILINSLILAFMLPYFDSLKISKSRDLGLLKYGINGIQFTALFSYCIYLIHLPIYNHIITSPIVNWIWILETIFALIIIFGIAALSYFYFENPILKWRDNLTHRKH